jgi:hypothetical protein
MIWYLCKRDQQRPAGKISPQPEWCPPPILEVPPAAQNVSANEEFPLAPKNDAAPAALPAMNLDIRHDVMQRTKLENSVPLAGIGAARSFLFRIQPRFPARRRIRPGCTVQPHCVNRRVAKCRLTAPPDRSSVESTLGWKTVETLIEYK